MFTFLNDPGKYIYIISISEDFQLDGGGTVYGNTDLSRLQMSEQDPCSSDLTHNMADLFERFLLHSIGLLNDA